MVRLNEPKQSSKTNLTLVEKIFEISMVDLDINSWLDFKNLRAQINFESAYRQNRAFLRLRRRTLPVISIK